MEHSPRPGSSGYRRGGGAAIPLPKGKILNKKKSLEGAEEIPTSRDRAVTPGSDTQLVSPLAFLLDLIHCSFTAVIISGKCKAGHTGVPWRLLIVAGTRPHGL